MENEELNKEASQKINEWAEIIITQIIEDTSSIFPEYSQFNLIMNVLTGCMVKMMCSLPDELRDDFVQLTIQNLQANLINLRGTDNG